MTHTLPEVTHEHHERLLHHVDRMPATLDELLSEGSKATIEHLDATVRFLEGTLLPHVEAAEATLYPELERMFQNRHSMAPMRREHEEIRRLTRVLSGLVAHLHEKGLTLGQTLAVRRVGFQLYALLKIHLAEEEAYLHTMDRGVTDDVAELLAAAMAHPGIDPD